MADPTTAPVLDLSQHFLLAMPGLEDDAFAGSLVYICEHTDEGALGICVNKPNKMVIDDLFEQMRWPLLRTDLKGRKILWGGPVHEERGFVLHEAVVDPANGEPVYSGSLTMPDGLQMTTSRDILEQVSGGHGPEKMLVALGCASWDKGQLEQEIADNSWLTLPANKRIIFDVPMAERYNSALGMLGITPGSLAYTSGRA